jgi:peptidoglycan hydrolase CwlO-like protein
MINKNEIQKIFNKLPEDKVELEKVQLGVVDDLQKVLSDMKSNLDEAKKLSKRVESFNKEGSQIAQAIKANKKTIQKLISETDKNESKGSKLQDKVSTILNKAEKAAKELGVDYLNIKGVKQADSLWDEIRAVNNYNNIDEFGGIFE